MKSKAPAYGWMRWCGTSCGQTLERGSYVVLSSLSEKEVFHCEKAEWQSNSEHQPCKCSQCTCWINFQVSVGFKGCRTRVFVSLSLLSKQSLYFSHQTAEIVTVTHQWLYRLLISEDSSPIRFCGIWVFPMFIIHMREKLRFLCSPFSSLCWKAMLPRPTIWAQPTGQVWGGHLPPRACLRMKGISIPALGIRKILLLALMLII